jgi:hypothetical protein
LGSRENRRGIASEIRPPKGYTRTREVPGSFASWLRHLPLKPKHTPVYLYNGRKKANQSAHFSVIDIDIGTRNLQQCADGVIRLRAEFLYFKKQFDSIHFNFTSGHRASFKMWASGYRPVVKGRNVRWVKKADPDSSYRNFRRYLKTVFTYAGSYSLNRELKPRNDVSNMRIGDVFIKGGFPGHAVVVVDMGENRRTGKKVFLLAQSYLPPQDIHVLKNPTNRELSPWYDLEFGETLQTPEWEFRRSESTSFAP